MRLRSPGPSTAWPRLLWAAATVLLLQSPTVTPAFAQPAAPQAAAGRQASALPPVPVPRPVPPGGAHLGDVALPVAGTAPTVIPPTQPGKIQAAAGRPSPPPPSAKKPPAHGVLRPAPVPNPRRNLEATSTSPPSPAASRLKPLGVPPPTGSQAPGRAPRFPERFTNSVQADNSNGCGFGANEPSVAQSSDNPSFIVVAAQENQTTAPGCAESHVWAFTSHDAGQNWQAVLLPGLQDPVSGDPVITFDPVRRVFVYAFVESTRDASGNPAAPGRIGVETSSDGVNWGRDTTLALDTSTDIMDKPMITVDQSPSSPHHGRVVVTWTDFGQSGQNFFDTYTDDGGASWFVAANAINFPLNRCGNGTSPAFDANGELMVAWWSCDQFGELRQELSSDGGASWSQTIEPLITDISNVGAEGSGTGQGFCELNLGGTAFRCNSFPSLVGDPNPNDEGGRAFVVVWDNLDGGLAHVRGVISLDGGSTWGGPAGFRAFNGDFADAGDKFFPWAAFSPSGRLNIGYSNRNASATPTNPHGTSYNEWLTEAGSLRSLVANSFITFNIDSTLSDPGSSTFIGDYSFTSSLDNDFDTFPAFTDQRGSTGNHVRTMDVCYARCFRRLTPYATPVGGGSTGFSDLFEINTDDSFGGSGAGFWNAVGIRSGADGTTVNDDMFLFGNRYLNVVDAFSGFGPPLNDYTVENDHNRFGVPPSGTYFPEVHPFSAGGTYTIEWASGFRLLPVGGGLPDSVDSFSVVRVYDVALNTGTTYRFGLRPIPGNTGNYSLTLHSASRGNQQGRPGAAADSGNVAPGQPAFISYNTRTDPSQFDGVVVIKNNLGTGTFTVFADTAVPTGSININGGARTTRSHLVTLNLAASNPSAGDPVFDMRLSNDGKTFGAWVPVAKSQPYTLPAGVGRHAVFVQYRNGAGGVSATFSHSIVTTT